MMDLCSFFNLNFEYSHSYSNRHKRTTLTWNWGVVLLSLAVVGLDDDVTVYKQPTGELHGSDFMCESDIQ